MAIPERTSPQRSLRIAFVTPEPFPGGGVPGMAVTLARGLAELGHQVDCWAVTDTDADRSWADLPGLRFRAVRGRFRWGRWYSRPTTAPILKSVVQLGTRALATPELARQLVAEHRARPYDVLYRFSTIELLGLGRHLGELPPLVVHPEVHAAGELHWSRVEADLARQCHSRAQRATVWLLLAARRRLQRRDIQRAEVVVVPSRRFGEALGRDYHLAPDRLVVVPNPIDLERFRPSDARTAHGKVRVTFVGRAAVRKGIDLLVDLSHRLDDLADEVELEVIATWSLWNDYRPLLEHANPRVAVVRPPVGNADLADVLADSDLLIQPSKYEPFAITVGEALASGTPVVVTEEVGAGEGLDPGCASVVPATAADLEAAVRTWVRRVQSGDVAPARRQARLEAERRFDPRTVSAAIAAVVESVAAHPAPLIR